MWKMQHFAESERSGSALQAAEGAVKAGVTAGGGAALPGMVFNSKKTVTWTDALSGRTRCEPAGRLECTMQVTVCCHIACYSLVRLQLWARALAVKVNP